MELSPGAFVAGKYRVVRILGRGAMGTVWEAVHTLTDRRVALKILAEDHKTTEARARILREARACGRIQHKNVIEVFDISELDDGRPFLVMPILHGETLEERIERAGPCSEAEALEIGVGVARALSAAHALGIVHRDLKPSNIFLHAEAGSGEVTVKVLDFGISKILSRDEASYTDAGRAVGSPAYMSPEQAKGAADLDGRSDVWSFGVCLFEMLTGGLPFPGETPYAMVGHILHGPPPDFDALCPTVSPRLRELLRRCVVRDASRRLGSAPELVAALEAARGEAPVPLAAPPPSRPFGSPLAAVTETVPLSKAARDEATPPEATSADAPPPVSRLTEEPAARAPAAITATSSVLITQQLPARRRGAWGLLAGGALALGGLGLVAYLALGRPPAPSSSAANAPPSGAASGVATAPVSATASAQLAAPPSPASAPPSASADANRAAASDARPESSATPPQAPPRGAPAGPRPRPAAPAKTGRVALPDSPG